MRRLLSTICALVVASVGLGIVGASPAAAGVHVDSTPDPSWRVDGVVYATKIVGDTIFVGGQFANAVNSTGTTVPRKNLAAFSMSTGNLLTGWQADATGIVRALESDGTSLYVGGSFPQIKGVARTRLAKLSVATSAVDTAFAPTSDNTVRALTLDGGNLLVGGAFTSISGTAKSRVAKVNAATGALVSGFDVNSNNTVYGFAVHPTSRLLYVAGNFSSIGGSSRTGMAVVNADTGALSSTVFASAARPTFGLSINEDGSRLFAAGGGSTNAAAAWNTGTGTRLWRQVAMGDVQAVEYFDDTVYFGFHDGFQGDNTIKLLAADSETGSLVSGFSPAVIGFWGIWALDVTAAGVVAAGDFERVAGVEAMGFARFKALSVLPTPPPAPALYVGSASPWKYWDQGTRPAGWETESFADAAWPSGLTQLGYGDGDETTVLGWGPSSTSKYITTYYRHQFTVDTVPNALQLDLAADDGAVIYINGVEAGRDNMPTTTISNTTRASTGRSGGAENELRVFALNAALLHPGTNTIAVEVHQDSATSSDLTFDADLKGIFNPPANTAPTAAFFSQVDFQDVHFDASGSTDAEGPIAHYQWNFGDGDEATGAVVDHTYAEAGPHIVTLRVIDASGARNTLVRTVTTESATVTTKPITFASPWKWRYAQTAPPTNWAASGFNDETWTQGNGVLGFGHASVVTNINTYATTAERPISSYFRKTFSITDVAKVESLSLRTVANDGVVVYVNGTEVGRSNMPTGTIGFTTYASSGRSTTTANANPVIISVPLNLLVEGTNTIAVETHLNARSTADVTFDLEATQISAR